MAQNQASVSTAGILLVVLLTVAFFHLNGSQLTVAAAHEVTRKRPHGGSMPGRPWKLSHTLGADDIPMGIRYLRGIGGGHFTARSEFRKLFRVPRKVFDVLLSKIEDELRIHPDAIPPEVALAICLQRLGTRGELTVEQHCIHKSMKIVSKQPTTSMIIFTVRYR